MGYTRVNVTTAATLIHTFSAANAETLRVEIDRESVPVYLGGASVTTGTGVLCGGGSTVEIRRGFGTSVYGIVASSQGRLQYQAGDVMSPGAILAGLRARATAPEGPTTPGRIDSQPADGLAGGQSWAARLPQGMQTNRTPASAAVSVPDVRGAAGHMTGLAHPVTPSPLLAAIASHTAPTGAARMPLQANPIAARARDFTGTCPGER